MTEEFEHSLWKLADWYRTEPDYLPAVEEFLSDMGGLERIHSPERYGSRFEALAGHPIECRCYTGGNVRRHDGD